MSDASGLSGRDEATRTGGVSLPGAIGSAVMLALLSVVPVAWSLMISPTPAVLRNSGFVQGPIDWQPIAPLAALALALTVVVSSAAVVGFLGGLVWRWRRFAGAAAALASAWAVGIVALPMAAAALGVHLRTGIVCVMGCEVMLHDDRPFAGPIAYGEFLAATIFFLSSLVSLALIILVVVFVLPSWVRGRPAARPRPPLIPSVIVFAGAHGIVVVWTANATPGGLVAYLFLSAGVVVWTLWMDRERRHRLDE
jgi:hypothetical protein